MDTKVLLVGESWVSSSTHFKGFDFFVSTHYATGGDFLIGALSSGGIEVVHQPSHEAARTFPFEKIVEAHQYLESNQQVGKIVVTL